MAKEGGEKGREVIRSLKIYLFYGRNNSTTAEKLYIHRNTLMYRLERLEQQLDINLRELDEQQFLNIYLSCLIVEMIYSEKKS